MYMSFKTISSTSIFITTYKYILHITYYVIILSCYNYCNYKQTYLYYMFICSNDFIIIRIIIYMYYYCYLHLNTNLGCKMCKAN